MSTVNSWTAWCCDTYQLVFSRHLAAWLFYFILWNRWQCFCSLWNLYANNQHLHLSPSHKQTWRTLCFYWWDIKSIHLLTYQGSAGLAQSRRGEKSLSPREMFGATGWQWNKHAGHAGPQSAALGLLKARPGSVHGHLQHYIKPASGLQPGSSACHGGGTGLCHRSKHLKVTDPVLHGAHILPTALR